MPNPFLERLGRTSGQPVSGAADDPYRTNPFLMRLQEFQQPEPPSGPESLVFGRDPDQASIAPELPAVEGVAEGVSTTQGRPASLLSILEPPQPDPRLQQMHGAPPAGPSPPAAAPGLDVQKLLQSARAKKNPVLRRALPGLVGQAIPEEAPSTGQELVSGSATALADWSRTAQGLLPEIPVVKLLGLDEAARRKSAEAAQTFGEVASGIQPIDPKSFAEAFAENPWDAVLRGVAQNAPQLASVIAAGYVGGGPAVLTSAFGMEFGGAYDEAVESGATSEQALAAGLMTGIPNAALESLVPARLLSGAKGPVRSRILSAVREGLQNAAEEGGTEVLQGYVGDLAALATYQQEDDWLRYLADRAPERMAELMTGALLGGPAGTVKGMAAPKISTTPTGEPAAPKRPLRRRIAERLAPELTEELEVESTRRAEAEREAETDSRTGAGNQRAFDRAREKAEADPNTAVVLVDLNNLKAINEKEGYDAGDEEISRAADAMREAGGTRLFRTGGDELAALVPAEQAEAVRDRAEEIFGSRDVGGFPVSLSGGAGQTVAEAEAQLKERKGEAKGGRSFRPMEPPAQATKAVEAPQEPQISPERPRTPEPGGEVGVTGEVPAQATPGRETAKVMPRQPATPPAKGETGKAVTSRDREVDFRWAVVEHSDLITSHRDLGRDERTILRANPDFDPALQPRERDRLSSALQIDRIANNLDPERLAESRLAAHGAPVVGPDLQVEAGNGRTVAIGRAYRQGRGDDYSGMVWERAGRLGIDQAVVEAMKQPVLVRMRETEVEDRAQLARELNEEGLERMSPTEQARTDAEAISPESIVDLKPTQDGSISMSNSPEFIRAFLDRLAPSEAASLRDPKGGLNVEGERRIRNAVLAKAFGDSDAILQVVESTDSQVRQVASAMVAAAPRIIQLQSDISRGALHPLDPGPVVAEAVSMLQRIRSDPDEKLADWLKQTEMFEERISPDARKVLAVIGGDKATLERLEIGPVHRSAQRLSRIFRRYAELVEGQGSPKQTALFGAKEVPDVGTMFQEAARTYEDEGNQGRIEFEDDELVVGPGGPYASVGRYTAERTYRSEAPRPAISFTDPELKKLYFRGIRKMHPDLASSEAESKKRTVFTQAFNAAAEVQSRQRMEAVLDAWERGDESPPEQPRTGRGAARPRPRPEPRKQPEPSAPSPPKKARRAAGDTAPERLPLLVPEMVELAQEMAGGRIPFRVKKALGRAAGLFRPTSETIDLRADLPTDPDQAAATLAHEVGHYVDSLPQKTLRRGNIFGSMASLKKYMKTMLDEVPTDPSRVFTAKSRARLHRAAEKQARETLGKGASPEDIRAKTAELYQEILQAEMVARRLVDRETVMDELWDLSTRWRPMPVNADARYRSYRQHPRELYADFFSALMNDPALVKRVAPSSHTLFFNYLNRKPEVADTYLAIQQRILEGEEARLDNIADRVTNMVRRGGLARARDLLTRGRELSGKVLAHAITDGLIDRNSDIYRRVRQARKQGRSLDPQANPIYWIEESAYHAAADAAYLDEVQTNTVHPLREAGVDDATFGALLGLRRAGGERAALWNPLGVGGEVAQAVSRRIKEKLGPEKAELVETLMKRWWRLRMEYPLRDLEKARVLSPEMLKKVKGNPEYVRFEVAEFIEEQAAGGGRGGGLRAFLQQIGTLKEIGNPFVETLLVDTALQRLAHRTQTVRSMAEFFRANFPDEIETAKRGAGGKFVEPRDRKNRRLVTYLEDGKTQGVYLPVETAEILEGDFTWSPAYAAFMRVLHNPLRSVLVERNPGWAIWNLARDVQAFNKNVVRGDPLTSTARTFKHMWRTAPTAFRSVFRGEISELERQALRGRMLVQPGERFYAAAEMDEEMATDAVMARSGILSAEHRATKWEKVGRWLDRWTPFSKLPGQFTERWTKLAGLDYLNEQHPEINEQEKANLVRTMVGTPDVYRRGKWFKFTNSFFLFSNVNKEGWRASLNAARTRPWEYAAKTTVFNVVPKVALLAAAHGLMGDDLEKFLMRVPEYDKRNFTIVPLGFDENGKAIYVRLPTDHTGQATSNLIWDLYEGEDKKVEVAQLLDDVLPWSWAALHPYVEIGVAAWQYSTGTDPVDAYYGRPVVPERVWEASQGSGEEASEFKGEARQYFARWMWNQVGGRVLYQFNLDALEDKSLLEKSLRLPVAGPLLARLVKVSDYGLEEMARRAVKEERGAKARSSLAKQRFIEDALDADPDASDVEIYNAMNAAELTYMREGVPDRARTLKRIKQLRQRTAGGLEAQRSFATTERERRLIDELEEEAGQPR